MQLDEREALRRHFHFRCGYCGVSERDAGAELTVDHFQPRSQGGFDEAENWVYSCHACNEISRGFCISSLVSCTYSYLRAGVNGCQISAHHGVNKGLTPGESVVVGMTADPVPDVRFSVLEIDRAILTVHGYGYAPPPVLASVVVLQAMAAK